MADHSRLDLYPAITGKQDRSFASFTIRNRLPYILTKVLEENQYPAAIAASLEKLKENIIFGKIGLLPSSGQGRSEWQNWIGPFIGKTWFELPFYFAEAYFYRMILDLSGYFENKIDPFAITKQKDLRDNEEHILAILQNLQQFFQLKQTNHERIGYLLHLGLWGNKSDLSQLQIDRAVNSINNPEHTLRDDSENICNRLISGCRRVDIILDNTGVELFTDLLMADALISMGLADSIVLHAKEFPTFVSDATAEDIRHLGDLLSNHNDKSLQDLDRRLKAHLESGTMEVKDHPFWNTPLHFCDMPEDLHLDLQSSSMIIFKGDANYRRIFSDRELPFDLSTKQIATYLPATAVAIRILKSEIITGLTAKEIYKTSSYEAEWLTNGKYGLIQLIRD